VPAELHDLKRSHYKNLMGLINQATTKMLFSVFARLTLVSRSNLLVGYGIATRASWFILGAEASGAHVDFSFLSFYHNRSPVNIR